MAMSPRHWVVVKDTGGQATTKSLVWLRQLPHRTSIGLVSEGAILVDNQLGSLVHLDDAEWVSRLLFSVLLFDEVLKTDLAFLRRLQFHLQRLKRLLFGLLFLCIGLTLQMVLEVFKVPGTATLIGADDVPPVEAFLLLFKFSQVLGADSAMGPRSIDICLDRVHFGHQLGFL